MPIVFSEMPAASLLLFHTQRVFAVSSNCVPFSQSKLINLLQCYWLREERDKDRGEKRRNESEKEQSRDFVEFRGQPGEKAQKKWGKEWKRHQTEANKILRVLGGPPISAASASHNHTGWPHQTPHVHQRQPTLNIDPCHTHIQKALP